jgi:hypothetical protein
MPGDRSHEAAVAPCHEDVCVIETCDQIRRKINTFIRSGGMKVNELINTLNISNASYYRFMRQRGRNKGIGSDTFSNALLFFRRGEELGNLVPKGMDLKMEVPTQSATYSTNWIAVPHLDGELDDAVEV